MRNDRTKIWLKLFICCVAVNLWTHFPARVQAASECTSIEDVDRINKGAIKRVAHFKNHNARIFVALDPIWSEPEFEYEGHRDEHFIASVRQRREELSQSAIDELVLWKLTSAGGRLGVAVPFKNGCAVSGYGEPDLIEKLTLMETTTLLISKRGLDDERVRDSIRKLLMASRYASHYNDEMVDTMIARLRPLIQ